MSGDPGELPVELVRRQAWVDYWVPRAEAGEHLPFHRSRIAEEISDLRDGWWAWYVKTQEENSRAKNEKNLTEGPEPRWYFGTFTQPDTNKDPHEILKNTAKLIKSKMVDPIEWCYSLELQQNGTPHTHYAFLTQKYPEYKKIHKFNCSKLKILQRSLTEPARNAEHAIRYVMKTQTKPSEEWLVANELKQTIWQSDNCPQF